MKIKYEKKEDFNNIKKDFDVKFNFYFNNKLNQENEEDIKDKDEEKENDNVEDEKE